MNKIVNRGDVPAGIDYQTAMASLPDDRRIDTASRMILASARDIYRAFLDPKSVATWRPPEGMTARVDSFDPRVGGGYRMAFVYEDGHDGRGKSSAREDVFEGRFVELLAYERIVEQVAFESDDPAFAGIMTITTTLAPLSDGTKVTFRCENVPPGILPEDHNQGLSSSLKNLAAFVE
jgi:uncharacterized protein YndB with AHSA1/START domain